MRTSTTISFLVCIVTITFGTVMIAFGAFAEHPRTPAPSFTDLESGYPRNARLNTAQIAVQMGKAQALVSASVPAGTPVAVAVARLQAAGATCHTGRHEIALVKCLYHQYDLSDGFADDIRWTVALHVAADNVVDVSIDRYVDRHGGGPK
jgi:hypothetical protein